MAADGVPPSVDDLKATIVDTWDARAEQWDAWTPYVDDWFAPATELLLQRLDLRPGNRLLELAAGSGGFTHHLARAVGPEGRVLATDSSPNMVKLAARHALAQGLTNVTTRVMDGERPDLSWASMDGVSCRQGVMFFARPQEALGRLLLVLRPGGRISVSVFTTGDRNGVLSVPGRILSRWAAPDGAAPKPPEGPGPFSLGKPGQLEGMLVDAGYEGVRSDTVRCALRMPSLDDLLRFYQEIIGDVLRDVAPARQEQAWEEVRQACAGFVGPASTGGPSEILVASGRRPTPSSLRSGVEDR